MIAVDRLTINGLECVGPHWYALRFTGTRVPFLKLLAALRAEREYNAYWCPGAFDGRGGWHISKFTLQRYADRFCNLEMKLGLAHRRAERVKEGKVS